MDDFVIFTVMNELCVEEKTEFIFNIRQCFRNFLIENMQNLEILNDKNYDTISEFSVGKNSHNPINAMARELASYRKVEPGKNIPRGLIF